MQISKFTKRNEMKKIYSPKRNLHPVKGTSIQLSRLYIYISLKFDFSFQWDSSESEYSEPEESNELGAIVSPEIYAMDTVDSASKRQATRVFKKSSLNGKITVYLGKRDFVDHITHVDPIGKILQLYSSRSPSPSLRVYLLNLT